MTKASHPATPTKARNIKGPLLWTAFLLSLIILSLGASWMTLKQVDFGYPFLHGLLNIDVQIQKYAPNNRYRDHFEKTTPAEQKRLFHEIVLAIHTDTQRLHDITYHAADATPLGKLLREPEIIHLEDVKVLVDRFLLLCLLMVPIAALIFWRIYAQQLVFPGMKKITMLLAIICLCLTVAVIAIGPTEVFYQLHIWLFPPENQWFFYYYESLMTTLMVAPVIFGPIALFLMFNALVYTIIALAIIKRICVFKTG